MSWRYSAYAVIQSAPARNTAPVDPMLERQAIGSRHPRKQIEDVALVFGEHRTVSNACEDQGATTELITTHAGDISI